jgi:predicted Zn-dependent protease
MYCSDDKYLFVVYTAMLTVCENKDGVATMFSHEVGHILAKHGAESVGKARMCELALRPAMILLANTRPGDLNLLEQLAAIYAVLIGVVSRSYSRQREYEADHIGVIIMHKARYDIKECARYYERMHKATEDQAGEQFKKMTEEAGEGQRVVRTPWFLLTHPIVS